jgi:hypothetical protein
VHPKAFTTWLQIRNVLRKFSLLETPCLTTSRGGKIRLPSTQSHHALTIRRYKTGGSHMRILIVDVPGTLPLGFLDDHPGDTRDFPFGWLSDRAPGNPASGRDGSDGEAHQLHPPGGANSHRRLSL